MAGTARGKNRELMGTENVRTLIPRMALPTIVAQLISTIYSLVDTYFVSQLGKSATAAVGVNSSLERAINMFAMLIGAGACSYIARLLGAERKKEADQVMTTSLFTSFGVGVLILIFGKIFLSPLVDFLGATSECKAYSMDYGTYVLLAAPFMICSFVFNMCLRSEGSANFAMIGMGIGGVLNCFLDPLFIFRFNLGVAGASMATAISKFVSFVILAIPYLRKKTVVTIAWKNICYRWEHIREVITIGMASFMRTALSVVASICMNRAAGAYSTSALAAISVANRVMMFPFSIILGFGQGYQPVAGFNWGAKKYDRVRESYSFAMKVALAGGVIMGLVIIFFAKPLIMIFNSESDAELLKYGCLALRFEAAALFMHAGGTVVNMFYAGVGRPREALACSTSRQGYCFIPMIFLLPLFFGVNGLCVAQFAGDVLALSVVIPLGIRAYSLISRAEHRKEHHGQQ